MSANYKGHTTFFTCEKVVQPIKTLIRQISHVKNILFQANTIHVNLYSHMTMIEFLNLLVTKTFIL